MIRRATALSAVLAALLATPLAASWTSPVLAQAAKPEKKSAVPGFGSNSKEPVQIDADKLEVFSKEQRAVYSGNVVAVQGDTTIKSAVMVVFYDRQQDRAAAGGAQKAGAQAPGTPPAEGEGGTQLRRVEAKGGVTVISKDQVATGNDGVFDRASNKIVLTGNVALSQGDNITKGEKLVYDTETGVALVESGPGAGRVKGFFVPGDDSKDGKGGKDAGKGKPDAKADPKKPAPKS
jgi:lipopolysaccharide export system protein LptA